MAPTRTCARRILIQEMEAHNQVLGRMHSSLRTLVSCMQGTQRFDAATDAFAHSIHTGRVPAQWLRVSPPTEVPLMAYLCHLNDSVAFFAKWARAGTPAAFWLPAFFFPRAIASAAAVNFSRHMEVGPLPAPMYVLRCVQSAPPRWRYCLSICGVS